MNDFSLDWLSQHWPVLLLTSIYLAFCLGVGWYFKEKATSGVESHRVMSAPIPTVHKLLEQTGMSMEDVDVLEHNEAFAAASCAIQMSLSASESRFNPHGGAVAIGHPLGATGTRCLMTLVNALERTGGHRGIVTICLGGGNAVAMMVERD